MIMLPFGFVAALLAFFIVLLATPLAARVAWKTGMIDVPQRHKAHSKPTPLLGGSAILAAVMGPSLLALALVRIWAHSPPESLPPDWLVPHNLSVHIAGAAAKTPMALGILLGAVLLHIVGLIDDRRNLGPWTKLGAQGLVAAMVVVLFDVRVMTYAGKGISIAASILWIVAITNSLNFLDNMDGLCAGVAAICCAALLGASAAMGQVFVSAWLCLLLGALLGFLVYNFPPAKIFMGDAGSMVIGYFLAVLTCMTTYVAPGQPFHLYALFAPIVLLAVPIYDTASVLFIRIKEGRNPMVGDRRHFSHRLLRRGMGVRSVVLTIYCCTVATAVAASLLPHADTIGAILIFAQTLAILAVFALLESGDKLP